jgi:hypothetical protein
LQLLLLVKVAGERIELVVPELFVLRHPGGGVLHRRGGELEAHHPALLRAPDQPGVLQNAKVFHESGKRHVVRLRQFGHVGLPAGERLQDVPARAVGKRREQRVQLVV